MQDLFAAIAIAIIIEGILPFANPKAWKKMVMSVSLMPERQLRIAGLFLMLLGLVLLQVVRGW